MMRTMRTRRSFLSGLAAAAAFVLLSAAVPPPAFAQSLADVKSQGLVGERPDGFVGLVRSDAPTAVQALVTRINDERRAQYETIAKRTGSTTRDVGIVAGSRLTGSAAPGTYVMTPQGQWVRK